MTQRNGLVMGCFDPLHYGHVRLLRKCKEKCDWLTVVVHEDDYIRKFKGREPYLPLEERLQDVISVRHADTVLRDKSIPIKNWAENLNTDVVFLSEEVKGISGISNRFEVVHMERTPGISSTKMREK